MNKIVNLSLSRKSVPTIIDVVQGATAPGITFILEDYTPPANARARIYILKEGGEVYNDCSIVDNQVTYNPTAGSFDVPGPCVAQLQITQGSAIAVSWRIFVMVEPNLIDGSAAPASTEFGALETLIRNAQQYDTITGANNIVGANNRQGWTNLSQGQDLDPVTGVGMYNAASNATAASLLNTPFTTSFKLIVSHSINNNSYIRQEAYESATGYCAYRVTRNGSFVGVEWIYEPRRGEVDAIVNRGSKNLCDYTEPTRTINGVTFTRNADGSVTANGTASGNAIYPLNNGYNTKLATGETFKITGCPSGGSAQTYSLRVYRTSGNTVASDVGNGAVFTSSTEQTYRPAIAVMDGTTVNNLTFYPMIRVSAIYDDTFVPYGMTNVELTAKYVGKSLNGVDLNDCTEDGLYLSATTTSTSTLINKPEGLINGFTMQVHAQITNPFQIIFETGVNPKIFIRSRLTTGWGGWKRVVTEDL